MKTLQELADEGILFKDHESELIKQNLVSTIKDSAQKTAVGRQIVQVIPMKEGSTLDWDKADKGSMIVRKIGESTAGRLTRETYTKIQSTPEKYGGTIKITKEMIEDSNFPLIERMLKQAGKEVSNTEDTIIFNSFADTSTGFPSETGFSINSQGTELGVVDFTNSMSLIEGQDFNPDTFVVHPTQVNELRQIDTFVEADKLGDRRVFETGWVGKIFGMDGVRSTNLTENVAYVLDKTEAGMLVIRRPLTIEKFNDPLRDLVGATFTQRMSARVVEAKAGVKITVQ